MTSDPKLPKTEAEWRMRLSPEQFHVLRRKGTERPFSGKLDGFYPVTEGYFACSGCSLPLYSSKSKFKSGCGWPAFDRCYKGALIVAVDSTHGMTRKEIMCSRCRGHLGHVFEGEGLTPRNVRHCVNSVSIEYVEDGPPDNEEVSIQ